MGEARAALAEATRLPDAADHSTLVATRLLLQTSPGDYRGVPELAERLAKDRQLAGHRLYELARGCAVAYTAANQDRNLPAAERGAVVKLLARAALEFLRRAAAANYFQDGLTVQKLVDEADFVTLRSAGEFKDLVKKLQSRGKGPARP
jgi:hypothetical protein